MGDVTIPHTFVNGAGNVIDATKVNANFVELRDAVNDLTIDNLSSALRELLIPTGTPMPTLGDTADSGFLLCDGAFVSQATYAALFAKVGHKCNGGVDPGDGTFKLPDLRGRSLVGKGTHADVDTVGENDGLAVGSRTPKHIHSLQGHSHTIAHTHSHTHTHSGTTAAVPGGNTGVTGVDFAAPPAGHTHTFTTSTESVLDTSGPSSASSGAPSVADSGLGTAPHLVVNWQIKT